MSTATPIQKLLTLSGKFIAEQKGTWEHEDWLKLVEKASKLGFAATDENKRNLGNILEAGKYFYHVLPAKPPKAKAKPKAKPKSK